MTIDEMKNKISMELGGKDAQLGFEIICKKLAELEKENEQLKAYESHWEEIEEDAKVIAKENEQLKEEKQQIQEQVKQILLDDNAKIGQLREVVGLDWCDKDYVEKLEKENEELKLMITTIIKE